LTVVDGSNQWIIPGYFTTSNSSSSTAVLSPYQINFVNWYYSFSRPLVSGESINIRLFVNNTPVVSLCGGSPFTSASPQSGNFGIGYTMYPGEVWNILINSFTLSGGALNLSWSFSTDLN